MMRLLNFVVTDGRSLQTDQSSKKHPDPGCQPSIIVSISMKISNRVPTSLTQFIEKSDW